MWPATRRCAQLPVTLQLTPSTVKFDTEKLPPILNALETTNNGQKLVLEVAVCQAFPAANHTQPANQATATSRRERREVHCHGRLVSPSHGSVERSGSNANIQVLRVWSVVPRLPIVSSPIPAFSPVCCSLLTTRNSWCSHHHPVSSNAFLAPKSRYWLGIG